MTMLNRMGNSSSYDEVESVDTSLAVEILAKSEQNQVVLPLNISPGVFLQAAADNNAINDETLDGKNTTHATTLAVFQRKSFGPECPPQVFGNHTVRKRSIKVRGNFNDVLEYSSRGKRPNITTYLGTLKDESLEVGGDKCISSCIADLVWAFTPTDETLRASIRSS